jgi:hypothetical protein
MAYEDDQDLLNQFQNSIEGQEYVPEEDESFEQPTNPLLEDALAQRDEQRKKADLLRGFQQLNQALVSGTGYKADMSMADSLEERSNDPLKKYKAMMNSQAAAKKEERASARDERDALAFDLSQEQKEQGMDLADSKEERASSLFSLTTQEKEESLKQAKMEGERLGMKINWEKIMDHPSDYVDPVTKKPNAAAVILKDDLQKRLNAEAEKTKVDPIVIHPSITLRELTHLDKIMDSGKSGMSEYQKQSLTLREKALGIKETGETRRGVKMKHSITQKQQDDAKSAVDSLRKTDAWKTASKTINEVDNINRLLDDAYETGGQSLAMIGPKVAKAIAGEVGVLTENDVKRYVQNPSLVGGLLDTLKKASSGQITETSYENLKRLLEISKKAAHEKINKSIDTEAELYSRREGISKEDARYLLDENYKKSIEKDVPKVELSAKDKAAKKWAESNKDDPRAKAILEKLNNKGL